MSNETKRDVFEEVVNELEDVLPDTALFGNEYIADLVGELRARYAAALPDDLPLIPKAVSKYIEDAKASHYELLDAMTKWTLDQPVFDWIHDNSDTFARAWLDGYQIDNKS